jgi:hypothetical protein
LQEHADKYRFDRRLHTRRGWIGQELLDKEIASLPDVSEKGEVIDSPQHPAQDAPAAESGGE